LTSLSTIKLRAPQPAQVQRNVESTGTLIGATAPISAAAGETCCAGTRLRADAVVDVLGPLTAVPPAKPGWAAAGRGLRQVFWL
jgi:hypothetical protein